MAEFCWECAHEELGISYSALERATFSLEPELCEGCGEYRRVLVALEPPSFLHSVAEDVMRLIPRKRF